MGTGQSQGGTGIRPALTEFHQAMVTVMVATTAFSVPLGREPAGVTVISPMVAVCSALSALASVRGSLKISWKASKPVFAAKLGVAVIPALEWLVTVMVPLPAQLASVAPVYS